MGGSKQCDRFILVGTICTMGLKLPLFSDPPTIPRDERKWRGNVIASPVVGAEKCSFASFIG